MSDDLAGWLLEQIAEDERTVQAALKRTRNWKQIDRPWWRVKNGAPEYRAVLAPEETLLAVWDPDRLLAECDAKRRIVNEYVEQLEFAAVQPNSPLQSPDETAAWEACVRIIAELYVDRDGYDESWRPS